MAAQSYTHVYMEMLETSADTFQEPATLWHRKMAGMAVGQYPERLLAYGARLSAQSHNQREFETGALSLAYGILRETASVLGTAVCRTARTVV